MKKILSLKDKLLVAILSLFGISACNPFDVTEEYGCPQTNFKVHGTVTDEQNNPLQGIAVQAGWHFDTVSHRRLWGTTDTTGPDGKYQITTTGMSLSDAPDSIAFSDADSSNANHRDTTLSLSFNGITPQGGDGHWFKGTYTLKKDIQL